MHYWKGEGSTQAWIEQSVMEGEYSRLEWTKTISRDYIIVGHEEVWTVRDGKVGHGSVLLQGAPQPVSLPHEAIIIDASVKHPY